jgi:hypothetical protein
VLDDPDIAVGLAGDTFAHRADHAVLRTADPQGTDDDEVVRRAGEVLQNLGVVLSIHHPRLELETGIPAQARHAIEVTVGDELEAHRDQAVVDLALPLELHFVDVLLGQRVLHLPEAVVVQLCRVDVAADQLRGIRLAQIDRAGNRAVGVVGVVDGNVNALIHLGLRYLTKAR